MEKQRVPPPHEVGPHLAPACGNVVNCWHIIIKYMENDIVSAVLDMDGILIF